MNKHLTRPERSYPWRRTLFRLAIWQSLYRFWFKLHVDGWENIPVDGPVLMMGNHIHALDPLIMISFFPWRDIVPMAKIEAFDLPAMRYFVGHWGAVPVDRGEADRRAIRWMIDHIKRGDIGMLYAEGHRSKTGLIQGQEGSVFIAARADAIVVPVAIWGTRQWPSVWVNAFRRVPIYISFGQPFRFRTVNGRVPRDKFREMTDEAMYRIAVLLPPEWRGIYAELEQATTNWLDFDLTVTPAEGWLPKRVQADLTIAVKQGR